MEMIDCEVVLNYLWDVGRNVDLNAAMKLIPGIREKHILTRKDTPESIILPRPLRIGLPIIIAQPSQLYSMIFSYANVYEDGVISLVIRVYFTSVDITHLFKIRSLEILEGEHPETLDQWIILQFHRLYNKIQTAINKGLYLDAISEPETYVTYCIRDKSINPPEFVQTNRTLIAKLLNGDNPLDALHESQIQSSLSQSFSYLEDDIIVIDTDRALILDANKNYEDILLIIELANYHLLEFRSLDAVLDDWLDRAEDEISTSYRHRWTGTNVRSRARRLIRLRFDAVFMLENLENTSKIIGDYYLGQLYKALSNKFQLAEWSTSIRNRLDHLANVYSIATHDAGDRRMYNLELLMAGLFLIEIILFLVDIFRF